MNCRTLFLWCLYIIVYIVQREKLYSTLIYLHDLKYCHQFKFFPFLYKILWIGFTWIVFTLRWNGNNNGLYIHVYDKRYCLVMFVFLKRGGGDGRGFCRFFLFVISFYFQHVHLYFVTFYPYHYVCICVCLFDCMRGKCSNPLRHRCGCLYSNLHEYICPWFWDRANFKNGCQIPTTSFVNKSSLLIFKSINSE